MFKDINFYLDIFVDSIKKCGSNRTKAFEHFLGRVLQAGVGQLELERVENLFPEKTLQRKVQEWDLAAHPDLPGTKAYFGSFFYEVVQVMFVQMESYFFDVAGKSKYLDKNRGQLESMLSKSIGTFIQDEIHGILNLIEFIQQDKPGVKGQELKTNLKLLFEIVSKKYFRTKYQVAAIEMFHGFFGENIKKSSLEQLVSRNKGKKYTLLEEQVKGIRYLAS